MRKLPENVIAQIISLRIIGHSIPEISKKLGVAKTTVQRHVLGVEVPEEFQKILKEKQGGSKDRATALRTNVAEEAIEIVGTLSERDLFLLLIGLYWGEGTKRDFGIINSDPLLIQAFIRCLGSLGIDKSRMSLALRVHSDISIPEAKKFWAKTTGLPAGSITRVEVIEGKKKGKLPFGMCRIRVRSGIRDRLLVQSSIQLIGKECSEKLVSV